MSERPTEFVVQRSKWLRGKEDGTVLLDQHGCMCCLGFVAKQCGVTDYNLLDSGLPSSMGLSEGDEDAQRIGGVLLTPQRYSSSPGSWRDADLVEVAVEINDSTTLTDDEREARLTALFAKHGYTLRFEP
jgi:hypothetical protein